MPTAIKPKRGLESTRANQTPQSGELTYVVDTKKIYFGDGSTAGGLEANYMDKTSDETIGGNKIFSGNITVQGTATSVDSTTVNIGDNIIVLNKDESGAPSANGGIEIERGTSTNTLLTWNESTDKWQCGIDGSLEDIALASDLASLESYDQDLNTTNDVAFNSISVAGDLTGDIVDAIPEAMTSDSGPFGTATSSALYAGNTALGAWHSFDKVAGVSDGASTTVLASNATSVFVAFEFPTATTISQYTVYPTNAPGGYNTNSAPAEWTVEGSNDGSSWTTLDTVASVTTWVDYTGKDFSMDTTGAYTHYRLLITENEAGNMKTGFWTSIGEWVLKGPENLTLADINVSSLTITSGESELSTAVHTSATSATGTATVSAGDERSGFEPWKALDGDDTNATRFSSTDSTMPVWWMYNYVTPQRIVDYSIICTVPDAAPKTFTMSGSNDTTTGEDGTWTVLDTQTDLAVWVTPETRNFTISSPSTYKFYKLTTTANFSDQLQFTTINLNASLGSLIIDGTSVDGRDVSADGAILDSHTSTIATHAAHVVDDTKHRLINDATGSSTTLYSGTKINTLLSSKAIDSAVVHVTGTETVGGNKTFSDNLTISGDLTVNGTTVSVNTATVNVGDNIMVLNSGEDGTPSQNGGMEIERGTSTNALMTWVEANDRWECGESGSLDYVVLGTQFGTHTSDATKHRVINDNGTSATDLLSAEKIIALAGDSYDQDLNTSDSVRFNSVSISGDLTGDIVDVIPEAMTSNSGPFGTATSSALYAGNAALGAWHSFDKVAGVSDGASSTVLAGAATVFVAFEFPTATTISQYTIYPTNAPGGYNTNSAPSDWVVEGSNNGSDWTLLDTESSISGWVDYTGKPFTMDATGSFTHYRLTISQTEAGNLQGGWWCAIGEWVLKGPEDLALGNIGLTGMTIAAPAETSVSQAPVHTASTDSGTGYIISASGYHDEGSTTTYAPFKAVDNPAINTMWFANTFTGDTWLKYQFTSTSKYITEYTILTSNSGEMDALGWVLQGSNDDSSWTTIDTVEVSDVTGWVNSTSKTFEVDTPGDYEYYRLLWATTSGDRPNIKTWTLTGTDNAPSSLIINGTSVDGRDVSADGAILDSHTGDDDKHRLINDNSGSSTTLYSGSKINTLLSAKAIDSAVVHTTGTESVGGNKTFTNNVTISGDFTVNGTTTSVNTATVNVGDNIMVLNSGEDGTPSQNGGMEIERGTSTNAQLVWNEATDKWACGVTGSTSAIIIEGDSRMTDARTCNNGFLDAGTSRTNLDVYSKSEVDAKAAEAQGAGLAFAIVFG